MSAKIVKFPKIDRATAMRQEAMDWIVDFLCRHYSEEEIIAAIEAAKAKRGMP